MKWIAVAIIVAALIVSGAVVVSSDRRCVDTEQCSGLLRKYSADCC